MIGRDTDAEVDELMRRAHDAGAGIIFESGKRHGALSRWTMTSQGSSPDAYTGAFTGPDGHMWQVPRADGVLIR